MMREIKFRVWHKERKEMYIKDLWANFWEEELGFEWNWEVMQFTGLKDKNGKEIYDGDTIQHNNNLYVIKFSERRCGWVARLIKQEANWRDGDWLRGCGKYIEIY